MDPSLPEVRRAVEEQGRWEWHGAPLDLDESAMLELFHRLRRHYEEADFPETRTPGSRFYFSNPAFAYADAITLFSMMREFRPKRIVEAGAGFSSALMMDANDRFFGGAIELEFLDPDPRVALSLLEPGDPYRERIRTLPLQEAGLVHRVQDQDGAWRFCAHARNGKGCPGGHAHFHCTRCGRMRCLTDQALPWVTVSEDEQVTGKQLVVYGLCSACAAPRVTRKGR